MSQDQARGESDKRPLHRLISSAPVVQNGDRAEATLGHLAQRCGAEPALAALGGLVAMPAVRDLLAGVFSASPHLTSLIERRPDGLLRALSSSPEQHFAGLVRDATLAVDAAGDLAEAMRVLRIFKADIALLVALCDLGGVWPVMTAARRLSEAADTAVAAAVRFLFRQAAARGDWLAAEPSGYIVLAMGKHGAFELNYSSDIDLIVFYDPARIRLRADLEMQ